MQHDLASSFALGAGLLTAGSGDESVTQIHIEPAHTQNFTPAHARVGRNRMKEKRVWVVGILPYCFEHTGDFTRRQVQTLPQLQESLLAEAAPLGDLVNFLDRPKWRPVATVLDLEF